MKTIMIAICLLIICSCQTFQVKKIKDYKYDTKVIQLTRLNAEGDREKINQFINNELSLFQRQNLRMAVNGYFLFIIYPKEK